MQTKRIVLYGLFAALVLLLGLTPLGFIYLPIAAITTVHIPVIVGGYALGKRGGALLGFVFGLTSFISCFTAPDATAAIVLGAATGFGPYNLLLILAVIFLPINALPALIIVLILTHIIFFLNLAKCFGKGTLFAIGLIVLHPIFIFILALDDSKYIFGSARKKD